MTATSRFMLEEPMLNNRPAGLHRLDPQISYKGDNKAMIVLLDYTA